MRIWNVVEVIAIEICLWFINRLSPLKRYFGVRCKAGHIHLSYTATKYNVSKLNRIKIAFIYLCKTVHHCRVTNSIMNIDSLRDIQVMLGGQSRDQ